MSKRIEFKADARVIAHLEAERARTGACFSEIIRRALLPPTNKPTPANYTPEIERRAAAPVLILSR